MRGAVNHTRSNGGQLVGVYAAPLARFSSSVNGTAHCGGQAWDIHGMLLKANGPQTTPAAGTGVAPTVAATVAATVAPGAPLVALARRLTNQPSFIYDPTHPGTKACAKDTIEGALAAGVKLMKFDFINWGAMEGAHFLPNVTTGMGAYNHFLKFVADVVGDRELLISYSMALTFPHQYAHSRRVGCDQMYGAVLYPLVTRYTHLHYHMYTYVHPLYTPNIPHNTSYTPHIHPIYNPHIHPKYTLTHTTDYCIVGTAVWNIP